MQKKLTITIDAEVYEGLYKIAGRGRISQYIESLIRPHVLEPDFSSEAALEEGYRAMAADEEYEAEALEWIEGTLGALDDAEPW